MRGVSLLAKEALASQEGISAVQLFNMQLNYVDRLVLLQRNPPLDKFIFGPESKFRRASDYGENNLLIPS